MEKLRASYPNIMELNLEKRQRSGGDEVYADVREKTPLELGESFLELTCGEAEEKRMEFLKKLLEEGGLNICSHYFLRSAHGAPMRAKIRLIFPNSRVDCF